MGYYQLACAGGDAYACFAQHIAANDNLLGHGANLWLNLWLWRHQALQALQNHAEDTRQCINEIRDQIRKGLAQDYANYLPNSEDQARWPTAEGVAQFHADELAKFGLPPSAFGGTPLGLGIGPVVPGIWCPNCQ